jgi:hypothetical protein
VNHCQTMLFALFGRTIGRRNQSLTFQSHGSTPRPDGPGFALVVIQLPSTTAPGSFGRVSKQAWITLSQDDINAGIYTVVNLVSFGVEPGGEELGPDVFAFHSWDSAVLPLLVELTRMMN